MRSIAAYFLNSYRTLNTDITIAPELRAFVVKVQVTSLFKHRIQMTSVDRTASASESKTAITGCGL